MQERMEYHADFQPVLGRFPDVIHRMLYVQSIKHLIF